MSKKVTIFPIKGNNYVPKIINQKNENAYGVLLHTRKSIEEFQINSGMKGAYKKEYQHHYWAANARLAVDGQVLDISIPLVLFNYEQTVTHGDIKFDLIEVEKVSNSLKDVAIAKFKELQETKIYKYINDDIGITDWQIIPLNTAHVHPGGLNQSFSGIDLRKDSNFPGVVYPLSKGNMIPSFSAIMAHIDDICRTVHSEYRLFNEAKNGDKVYSHGRCATIVRGFIPEPLPRVKQPEPTKQGMIDKIFNITPKQPTPIKQKEAPARPNFILKDLLGFKDGEEFIKEIEAVWLETIYDPETTMVKEDNIKKPIPVVRQQYYGAGNPDLWQNQKKEEGDAKKSGKIVSLFDQKAAIVKYELASWSELQGQTESDIENLYEMVIIAEKDIEKQDEEEMDRIDMLEFLETSGYPKATICRYTDEALFAVVLREQEKQEKEAEPEFDKDEAVAFLLKQGYKIEHLLVCTENKLKELIIREEEEEEEAKAGVNYSIYSKGETFSLDEIEKIKVLLEEEKYLSFAKINQMSDYNIIAYYQEFYQIPGED